jgi:hypothetical protein
MKICLMLILSFSCLSIAGEDNDKFIRKVMDYEKNNGEKLVRLKCVRNPPLNRCPESVFKSMAKEDCDPNKYKMTKIRTRGCTRDLKSGEEVCNFADVICEEIEQEVNPKKEEVSDSDSQKEETESEN